MQIRKDGLLEINPHDDGTGVFEILFTGDLCPRNHSEELVLEGKSGEMLAELMDELSACDLSVVNLETPLTRSENETLKSGPCIKVDPVCVELLKCGRWDVACCANNHMGDFGPGPVIETMYVLEKNGIQHVGAGRDLKEAAEPLYLDRDGLKIALIGLAENEFGTADHRTAGANPLNPLRNIKSIKEAASSSDITLVLIHGGNEYNPVPSPRMVDTYRAFAEAGASAVIAGHTHCPQGIEIWDGVPIVYSLGNFLFPASSARPYRGYNWWYGYMARIGFRKDGAVRLQVIPHHCTQSGDRAELIKGEDRERFIEYLNVISEIIKDEVQVRKYFEAWCMREKETMFRLAQLPFYPTRWDDPQYGPHLMARRNLHTCEAHNELLTVALRITAERREEEAGEYLPALEKLFNGEIPE